MYGFFSGVGLDGPRPAGTSRPRAALALWTMPGVYLILLAIPLHPISISRLGRSGSGVLHMAGGPRINRVNKGGISHYLCKYPDMLMTWGSGWDSDLFSSPTDV